MQKAGFLTTGLICSIAINRFSDVTSNFVLKQELHAELKDVKSKFHMTKETLKVAVEERHGHEKTLKVKTHDFK